MQISFFSDIGYLSRDNEIRGEENEIGVESIILLLFGEVRYFDNSSKYIERSGF